MSASEGQAAVSASIATHPVAVHLIHPAADGP
jgi:hypothetical protein